MLGFEEKATLHGANNAMQMTDDVCERGRGERRWREDWSGGSRRKSRRKIR